MTTPDGRVALVFNGEIYNYRPLRRELSDRFEFRSDTDSEVLLHGYRAWGWDGLLRRVDGMFAFAVWDADTRTLHAARDRMGKKPLFYAHTADGFAFASTLNALRALVPDGTLDPEALDAYLTYQAVPAPYTLFRACRQLPPAHQLTYAVEADRLAVARYWDVPFAPKRRRSEAEVLDDLDGLIRAAVGRRLESDVPLGAFLSGGVDSSLVVAMMAQEQSNPVEAVVIGFDDPAFDERPFARQVARALGREPPRARPPPGRGRRPPGDHLAVRPAPRRRVDRPDVLRREGGEGARHRRPQRRWRRRGVRRIRPARRGASGADVSKGASRCLAPHDAPEARRGQRPPRTRPSRPDASRRGGGHRRRSVRLRPRVPLSPRPCVRPVARRPTGAHPDALYRAVWDHADGADEVDRALYGDLTTYLPDQLLAKMDVSTMAHSVEARSPLLDTALIEYAAQIPTSLRLKGFTTKYLLKKLAERYVPREVLYRRKRGFVMPAADWLRGDLAPYVEKALMSPAFRERGWIAPAFTDRMLREHAARQRDWGNQLWTLFVLEVWARMALDGTLQRGDSLEALR